MKHLLLLMKYNFILRAKAFISFRSGFLFLLIVCGILFLFNWKGHSSLYQFTYYTEDTSYAAQIAIQNFAKSFEGIAQIKKVEEPTNVTDSDVFFYFPKDFALKWQQFSESPVTVTILHKSPLHRILLTESFRAYEDILFASESILRSYHQFLYHQDILEEQFNKINQKISLDFISEAINRQKLSKNKVVGIFPANLSKEYYLIGFSLFFGVLFALYFAYEEGIFYDNAKRIMLANVSGYSIMAAGFLVSSLYYIFLSIILFLLIQMLFRIDMEVSFYIFYPLVMMIIQQGFQLLSILFKDKDKFLTIFSGMVFFLALLGGLFLPITLIPSEWISWIECSPFYRLFYYMMYQTVNAFDFGQAAFILAFLLVFIMVRFVLWRKYRYV